jgi:uncharacterized damage-inducible protein DinB
MTPAITLDELLAWNEESAAFWNEHLTASPNLLELPCTIGRASTVQEFIRHIWGVELIWAQRISGLPQMPGADMPKGPLTALWDLHVQAMAICRRIIDDPAHDWDATLTLNAEWLPEKLRTGSHRKFMAHALFHSQRHWAQLTTRLREAGFPADFKGDMLFSLGLS